MSNIHDINREQLLKFKSKDGENNKCADCESSGTNYVDIKLGCFLCTRCAGLHRGLGTDISRIKSISFDTLKNEDILFIKSVGGNKLFNKKYEGIPLSIFPKITNKSDNIRANDYIIAKYVKKIMFKDVPTDSTKKVLKSRNNIDLPPIKSIAHKFIEQDKTSLTNLPKEPTKKESEITKPLIDITDDAIKISAVKVTNPFDDIVKDNNVDNSVIKSSLIDDLSDLFNSNKSIEKTKQSEILLNPIQNDIFDAARPELPKKSYEDIKNDIMKMYEFRS